MAKTVLILGGAFAGLHVAHGLLKKNDKDVKVVLVSKVCDSQRELTLWCPHYF